MNKEFIPYKEALALKELGFNESCFGYYTDGELFTFQQEDGASWLHGDTQAPLYQQAFRWFREKYRLLHFITPNLEKGGWNIQVIHYNGYKVLHENNYNELLHEEAELACLRKLIEIVNKNKDD